MVSPFESALQSARSMDPALQSALSMDPPPVAGRLRSTPAGTMFVRPDMGGRRLPSLVTGSLGFGESRESAPRGNQGIVLKHGFPKGNHRSRGITMVSAPARCLQGQWVPEMP